MNGARKTNLMSENGYLSEPAPAKNYKDRLFRMIFKDKKEFLELYNAMNGTNYDNPEDLIVTTLENAVYIGMKNDISYLLFDQLSLYEHQSTDNPNMPLRNLLYVSDIYSNLTKDENLHGARQILIPEPRFVVFYNGMEEIPEQKYLRLSDAYKKNSFKEDDRVSLELVTEVININPGNNEELKEKCKSLREYMIYVTKVRTYSQDMGLSKAVERAITECIQEDILSDFLRRNRAEVYKACLYEYNEEKQRMLDRRDAQEDGRKEGIIEGKAIGQYIKLIQQVRKKVEKSMDSAQIADMLEEDETIVSQIVTLLKENMECTDEKLAEKLVTSDME